MSDSINDIESYRKKRRRKRWIKRIILFLILALVIGGALLAFSYFQDFDFSFGQDGDGENTGFPIALAGDQTVSLGRMGNDLVLLSDTRIQVFTESGKQVMSSNHGYSNPVFKSTDRRLLVYDRGGGGFKLENSRGTVQEKTLTDNIVLGEISDEGNVAIVTQSDRYSSVLHVYDSALEELFVWYSEDQIVALDFKDGGRGCVAATISTQGGEMISSLTGLDFSSEEEEYSTDVKGVMALSVDIKASGQTQMIGDTMACSFGADGSLKNSYPYNKKLLQYANHFDKGAVLLLTDADTNVENTAVVLGSDGLESAAKQVESRILDMDCSGDRILLIAEETAYSYNLSLEDEKQKACGVDAQRGVLINSNAYIMGAREIQKVAME